MDLKKTHGIDQGCTILHGVLTISSDIGRFEQYRNVMDPSRPDKNNFKENLTRYDFNWFCPIHNGLHTTRNYPNIARYRPISGDIAQNMGPFNVTITVKVHWWDI